MTDSKVEQVTASIRRLSEVCKDVGIYEAYILYHHPWETFRGDLRAVLAALSQPPVLDEREGWQPIETAPKDGKTLLVWGEWLSSGPVAAQWASWFNHIDGKDCEGWREASEYSVGDVLHGATHWRPLPAPPRNLGGAE